MTSAPCSWSCNVHFSPAHRLIPFMLIFYARFFHYLTVTTTSLSTGLKRSFVRPYSITFICILFHKRNSIEIQLGSSFFLPFSSFRLEGNRFRNIVRHLLQFISIRQFPAGERGLPAPTRSRWWIPTSVRVLALLSIFLFHILNNSWTTRPCYIYCNILTYCRGYLGLISSLFPSIKSTGRSGEAVALRPVRTS